MIQKVVETWRGAVAGGVSEALDGLLADDVVFYSPIVYTPQHGKAVTTISERRPDAARRPSPRRVSLHEVGPRRRRRHARVRDDCRRQIRQWR